MDIKINYESKPISTIKEGDLVISKSSRGNVIRHVSETFNPTIPKDEQVLVETENGNFVSSLSHRMMTNRGYMTIYSISFARSEIQSEQEQEVFLINEKGRNVSIESISPCGISDSVFYDLSIDNDHCYYIGDEHSLLLSHNSATVHVPFWHYEIEDIMVLKNNAGTDDNRVRKLDYSIQFCKLFYDRLIANEDITLFSPHEAKGLYEAFGDNDKFEELYLKYENARSLKFKKKVPARKLAEIFARERLETGRIYSMNIDSANEHGSWSVPVHMSNLCIAGDSAVTVEVNGRLCTIPIKEVVEMFEMGAEVKILSFDEGQNQDCFSKVLNAGRIAEEAEVIEVHDEESGFYIECTEDHKIFTQNRGYVKAGELNPEDKLKVFT